MAVLLPAEQRLDRARVAADFLSAPQPGYQLPAGTYLYPIEKDVYDAWLADNGDA